MSLQDISQKLQGIENKILRSNIKASCLETKLDNIKTIKGDPGDKGDPGNKGDKGDTGEKGGLIVNPPVDGTILFNTGTQGDFQYDHINGTNGWTDLICNVDNVKSNGLNVPNFTDFLGDIYAYEFKGKGTAVLEIMSAIHIPHDFAYGTGVYFHVHWSTNSATPSGDIKFGFEYRYASIGSNFNDPNNTGTVYATKSCTTQYKHEVSEISLPVLTGIAEVDGIIFLRIFRDPTDTEDTSDDSAFVFFTDCHIQVNKYATIRRNKDTTGSFYV